MDCFVGIDLGSTTTKAIFLDKDARILGKGITNSRSNYSVACQVAKEEAEISSRFFLLSETLKGAFTQQQIVEELMEWLSAKFLLAEYKKQLSALKRECLFVLDSWSKHVEEKEKFNHALE
ncbi:MAG: hypothetical protein HY072_02885, partial [Deltaproteobacteria bacterium]|nr:hypothetical protein [Deltaproteobacteria bacterium]